MNLPVPLTEITDDVRIARLVNAFLAGKCGHTKRAYERDIPIWLDWCRSVGVDPLDPRRAHVLVWLQALADTGAAEATRARRLAAISSWYRWMVREGQCPINPCDLATKERPQPDRAPAGGALAERQTDRLMAAADADPNPRTAAMIGLLAYTGVRVAELVAADDDDITLDRGHRVLRVMGKGRQRRLVPLPPGLFERIEAYRAARPGASVDRLPTKAGHSTGLQPLFVTGSGKRVRPLQVRRDIQRMAKRAGDDLAELAKDLSPHWLRRAYATDLLAEGVPVRDVQYAMGHADPRTTERYDRGSLDPDRHPTYRRAAQLARRSTRHDDPTPEKANLEETP
jgi:integrase/recombinase XerD